MPTDLDRSDLLLAPPQAEEFREDLADQRHLQRPPRSLGRDAVRRFTKNKLAILG